jgi:hypothetical protein
MFLKLCSSLFVAALTLHLMIGVGQADTPPSPSADASTEVVASLESVATPKPSPDTVKGSVAGDDTARIEALKKQAVEIYAREGMDYEPSFGEETEVLTEDERLRLYGRPIPYVELPPGEGIPGCLYARGELTPYRCVRGGKLVYDRERDDESVLESLKSFDW